ncbi:cardiolipin synthase [Anaerosphaera aminiphila DSM 21120]|uniref:Cardiolipin synthase n=1 Tax=Anaerosphaera aminiphila DSM 21120 TaxID=1120995 RepID=A0A1M5TJB8_9FIRM|nr:cardiolipin synthase [Anaerosphaera aminiphila]SHH50778.1 cardiolipin synthase [Anaerosphaera aminiphila DSM 21120]
MFMEIYYSLSELILGYSDVLLGFIQSYSIIFFINVIFTIAIIFMERKKPTSTLLWVMAINFLPIIGFILYLFIGQDLSKKRIFDKKDSLKIKMRKNAQSQLNEIKSGKFKFKNERTREYVEMIEMFNVSEDETFYQGNDIEMYSDGREMFKKLFEDIEAAEKSVYFESYIFKSDGLGTELMNLLKKKSREGVEVLLLVDGMGARNLKQKDRRDLVENGVKLAIFFPGLFGKFNTHINYRNHRKIIVIDHKIGYVGGLNVGDEYISKDKKFGFWRDDHIRIIGPAVMGLQFRFFLDYNFAADKKEGAFITPVFEKSEYGNKDICIVTSGPDTKVDSIRNGYEKIISRARKKIYIQTPYFVPDEGLFNALKVAALSGCEVNIMIPEIRDHPFVHWASTSFIGELLDWGCRAYYYQGGFLHSKVICCDDYLSSIGTANFDIRSFELNFEANAFIFDEEVTSTLIKNFENDVKNSKEITLADYERRSVFVKIKEGVSRLLSPIL